ncbi:class I SAM-dependent rRNA methyltransferase [Brevibacillus centrosporus]|uniref:class I SAM-dependent rRNA methyltransferase n=1 Tax=Brevibacillus centrosporus TaxID=54910 RepID=UPI000F0A878B|nr:class I SAM-dependent rRNA methyltransferase [Brevibacillus centrosporus]MEC2130933.1 class I SAM-dependent rRNA methyltransferase [Brevibacillus centrosporus]MED4907552.1 class I SAM-dependent rRNA methyltransferase [Brevibacillus centrosporus]RNB63404.1 class I SAM-dependent rRNA methyltransferase [Brevibacillus centrosporus]GED31354.1 SAM-dependent methyltransferase [Brevibacillus centrosporus]
MAKVLLNQHRKKRLETGHPWIYQSEVLEIQGDVVPGEIVEVTNHKGHFLAKGYINPASQMIVRILSFDPNEAIDYDFFLRKIRQAAEFRTRFVDNPHACRVIYGEADFLPGLIVDRYNDVLVVQVLSLGMEQRIEWIRDALVEVFAPEGIYLRNDVPVRKLEGLEQGKGVLYGECPREVLIEENGLKYYVDIVEGQKTGFFYDQRENRASIAPLMKGWGESHGISLQSVEVDGELKTVPVDKRGKAIKNPFWDGAEVLECFTHTGSFTLNACKHGAKKVTALDISEHAIETAKRNITLNGFLHRVDFVVANAFDYLRENVEAGRSWDVVILDPPAFAKSRGAVKGAIRGYKDINLNGLKLVRPGGFLVTASCSYHMSPELFLDTIQEAAIDAKKILRLIEWRGAGKDHPQISGADEAHYLKFAIFEVRDRK